MHTLLMKVVWAACLFTTATTAIAEEMIEDVIVVAHPLSGEGLSQAVDVLEGGELERKLSTNIGATLSKQPGIHSASFGSAVGRPVIHGLGGPRVKIMEDRIDTLDVSVTSGDHAVSVEPFIAERIEVLKGAGILLYGSGAIGGVVDVHTGRIPHYLSDQSLSGGFETRHNSNSDGNTTSLKLNGSEGNVAWHVDGTRKDANNYDIPGFAESAELRALEPGEEHISGTLLGSGFTFESGAIGASYIKDWGFVGISVSDTDADYGLPGHAEGGATPTLELAQTRTDFELGLDKISDVISSINLRLGVNDYEHQEIEPDGEVATRFSNKAWEARAEFMIETGDWTHVLGLQHSQRDFSALGEEAFIQPVDTAESGIFWLGERSINAVNVEAGLRVGEVRHSPSASVSKDFSNVSGSLGAVIPFDSNWQLNAIVDYSSRAPVAEELYSDGPHLTTNSYEIGDATLKNESAINVSATLQYQNDRWSAAVTAYQTEFSNFIYQQANGNQLDDLPVFIYQQQDATFVGADAEVAVNLIKDAENVVQLKALYDFVDAELDVSGSQNLPRIPPARYGLGLETSWGRFSASLDYLRVKQQQDTADFEFATDAYNDLGAYAEFTQPLSATTSLIGFVLGKNLTNDEQRAHTSFIKSVAPAPGRSVEIGFRLIF